MDKLPKGHILRIEVRHTRVVRFRVWVASKLFWAAGRILGADAYIFIRHGPKGEALKMVPKWPVYWRYDGEDAKHE